MFIKLHEDRRFRNKALQTKASIYQGQSRTNGSLRLPSVLWLLACCVSIPLFGAVSSYGACSVLGVPFAYIYASLLGGNAVVVLAAISLIASVGDMMPPTALAGLFAAQVTGVKDYTRILKKCIIPIVILLVWAAFFLANSKLIAGLF